MNWNNILLYKKLNIKNYIYKHTNKMENLIHLITKSEEFDITNINKDETKDDMTEEEIKKYKKNYPQQDEKIIKTEIPPSNWGPEYWKILEKIIKGQKKEEIDINPQEYEDRKAYKTAANAVQMRSLDLLKTFEDIRHVFAKTGAESETEARYSFQQVDQYKELQKRNTEEKQ